MCAKCNKFAKLKMLFYVQALLRPHKVLLLTSRASLARSSIRQVQHDCSSSRCSSISKPSWTLAKLLLLNSRASLVRSRVHKVQRSCSSSRCSSISKPFQTLSILLRTTTCMQVSLAKPCRNSKRASPHHHTTAKPCKNSKLLKPP
jgi:hypothetical protein